MTTQKIDLSQLDSAQLEAALKERKKLEAQERANMKEQYESERDILVTQMVESAEKVKDVLQTFKMECYESFEQFRERANEYGDIRSNSKGGFSLRSNDGNMLARLERNVIHEFDERADLALDLIKDFLETTIKKRDLKTHRVISSLLQRNKSGDLKPERVASFLEIKDNYDDERWVKAMRLLEESYRPREVSWNVAFYRKDKLGKDQPIVLTFSSLPIEDRLQEVKN